MALAEDRVAPPEYFVATAMETSTAQVLAISCPTLSVDLGAMARRTETALNQLTEDGFTPETLEQKLEDPTDAIAERQDAFMAKHGLETGAEQSAVCAAGRAEIEEGTAIGALLLEVEE